MTPGRTTGRPRTPCGGWRRSGRPWRWDRRSLTKLGAVCAHLAQVGRERGERGEPAADAEAAESLPRASFVTPEIGGNMSSRNRMLAAASAFIGLIVLTSSAGGTLGARKPPGGIPNPAGVYAGCYRVATGALRMISTSRRCRKNERRVTWNRRGLAGPRGLQGLVGPPGPAGVDGAPGPPR